MKKIILWALIIAGVAGLITWQKMKGDHANITVNSSLVNQDRKSVV